MISFHNSKFHEKIMKKYGRRIRKSYFPNLFFKQDFKSSGQGKIHVSVHIKHAFHNYRFSKNISSSYQKEKAYGISGFPLKFKDSGLKALKPANEKNVFLNFISKKSEPQILYLFTSLKLTSPNLKYSGPVTPEYISFNFAPLRLIDRKLTGCNPQLSNLRVRNPDSEYGYLNYFSVDSTFSNIKILKLKFFENNRKIYNETLRKSEELRHLDRNILDRAVLTIRSSSEIKGFRDIINPRSSIINPRSPEILFIPLSKLFNPKSLEQKPYVEKKNGKTIHIRQYSSVKQLKTEIWEKQKTITSEEKQSLIERKEKQYKLAKEIFYNHKKNKFEKAGFTAKSLINPLIPVLVESSFPCKIQKELLRKIEQLQFPDQNFLFRVDAPVKISCTKNVGFKTSDELLESLNRHFHLYSLNRKLGFNKEAVKSLPKKKHLDVERSKLRIWKKQDLIESKVEQEHRKLFAFRKVQNMSLLPSVQFLIQNFREKTAFLLDYEYLTDSQNPGMNQSIIHQQRKAVLPYPEKKIKNTLSTGRKFSAKKTITRENIPGKFSKNFLIFQKTIFNEAIPRFSDLYIQQSTSKLLTLTRNSLLEGNNGIFSAEVPSHVAVSTSGDYKSKKFMDLESSERNFFTRFNIFQQYLESVSEVETISEVRTENFEEIFAPLTVEINKNLKFILKLISYLNQGSKIWENTVIRTFNYLTNLTYNHLTNLTHNLIHNIFTGYYQNEQRLQPGPLKVTPEGRTVSSLSLNKAVLSQLNWKVNPSLSSMKAYQLNRKEKINSGSKVAFQLNQNEKSRLENEVFSPDFHLAFRQTCMTLNYKKLRSIFYIFRSLEASKLTSEFTRMSKILTTDYQSFDPRTADYAFGHDLFESYYILNSHLSYECLTEPGNSVIDQNLLYQQKKVVFPYSDKKIRKILSISRRFSAIKTITRKYFPENFVKNLLIFQKIFFNKDTPSFPVFYIQQLTSKPITLFKNRLLDLGFRSNFLPKGSLSSTTLEPQLLCHLITPIKSLPEFSVKPFLKRVVSQPLRRLITPLPGVFDQTFFEKVCVTSDYHVDNVVTRGFRSNLFSKDFRSNLFSKGLLSSLFSKDFRSSLFSKGLLSSLPVKRLLIRNTLLASNEEILSSEVFSHGSVRISGDHKSKRSIGYESFKRSFFSGFPNFFRQYHEIISEARFDIFEKMFAPSNVETNKNSQSGLKLSLYENQRSNRLNSSESTVIHIFDLLAALTHNKSTGFQLDWQRIQSDGFKITQGVKSVFPFGWQGIPKCESSFLTQNSYLKTKSASRQLSSGFKVHRSLLARNKPGHTTGTFGIYGIDMTGSPANFIQEKKSCSRYAWIEKLFKLPEVVLPSSITVIESENPAYPQEIPLSQEKENIATYTLEKSLIQLLSLTRARIFKNPVALKSNLIKRYIFNSSMLHTTGIKDIYLALQQTFQAFSYARTRIFSEINKHPEDRKVSSKGISVINSPSTTNYFKDNYLLFDSHKITHYSTNNQKMEHKREKKREQRYSGSTTEIDKQQNRLIWHVFLKDLDTIVYRFRKLEALISRSKQNIAPGSTKILIFGLREVDINSWQNHITQNTSVYTETYPVTWTLNSLTTSKQSCPAFFTRFSTSPKKEILEYLRSLYSISVMKTSAATEHFSILSKIPNPIPEGNISSNIFLSGIPSTSALITLESLRFKPTSKHKSVFLLQLHKKQKPYRQKVSHWKTAMENLSYGGRKKRAANTGNFLQKASVSSLKRENNNLQVNKKRIDTFTEAQMKQRLFSDFIFSSKYDFTKGVKWKNISSTTSKLEKVPKNTQDISNGFLVRYKIPRRSKKKTGFSRYPGIESTDFVFSRVDRTGKVPGIAAFVICGKKRSELTYSRDSKQKTKREDFVYGTSEPLLEEVKKIKRITLETREIVADHLESHVPQVTGKLEHIIDIGDISEKIMQMINYRLKIEAERRGIF